MQHDSILLLLLNHVTTYQLPKSETSSLQEQVRQIEGKARQAA